VANIIELRFSKNVDLCRATQRFSHYYEVEDFVGKIVTWEKMDEFYEKKYSDKMWWCNRYAGANIPDHVFKAFLASDLSDYSPEETRILDIVRDIEEPYYVIMTSDEALYVRDHEIAHAMWYLIPEYHDKARKIVMDNWDEVENIRSHIKRYYADEVMVDELHAYIGVYTRYLLGAFISFPMNMHSQLAILFSTYARDNKPEFISFGRE